MSCGEHLFSGDSSGFAGSGATANAKNPGKTNAKHDSNQKSACTQATSFQEPFPIVKCSKLYKCSKSQKLYHVYNIRIYT